ALDLELPGQRRPLCVPLSRLQYLHLDTLPEAPDGLGELHGPRVALLEGEGRCVSTPTVDPVHTWNALSQRNL
ncbi:MAG TPA: hypothetical protein VK195_20380, partial [Burkholderiaceae bacterium]|nr:hypothetical protein [Burkholderiaceae bacterium]